jgi:hypothetical protein
VRTLCAWCGSTIAVRCNHCNAPLATSNFLGGTFAFYRDAMICLNGETPLIYSADTVAHMEKTYGLCQPCQSIPADERDAMLKARRAIDKSIPNDTDLAAIAREIEITNRHEQETRRHRGPHEKRGPTVVTRSATTHVHKPQKKSGDAQ